MPLCLAFPKVRNFTLCDESRTLAQWMNHLKVCMSKAHIVLVHIYVSFFPSATVKVSALQLNSLFIFVYNKKTPHKILKQDRTTPWFAQGRNPLGISKILEQIELLKIIFHYLLSSSCTVLSVLADVCCRRSGTEQG